MPGNDKIFYSSAEMIVQLSNSTEDSMSQKSHEGMKDLITKDTLHNVSQTEKSLSSPDEDPVSKEIAEAKKIPIISKLCIKEEDRLDEYEHKESSKNSSPDISTFNVIYWEYIFENSTLDLLLKLIREKQFYVNNYEKNEDFIDVFQRCKHLFNKDYDCNLVDNSHCPNYPPNLIIPVAERGVDGNSIKWFDENEYAKLAEQSSNSRCRSRYAVPVIFAGNKFICRSATLSVRIGAAYEMAKKARTAITDPWNIWWKMFDLTTEVCKWILNIEAVYDLDVAMLKTLHVEFICDFMVENRKIYHNALTVSSSEKIEKDVYCEFKIEQMPYPGCEFFRDYHRNNRNPVGLQFDWDHEYIDAELKLSDNSLADSLGIDLGDYKSWDLVELTKNYMKILLSYFVQGTGGILVHCISGWDRTPMIVSLLRLSLWADGIVHKNLNHKEIAYLTIGYDWFLFGHDLPTRLEHKEEIMHFCFKFLAEIATDEFSATRMFKEMEPKHKGNRQFPEFTAERRSVLADISNTILELYD